MQRDTRLTIEDILEVEGSAAPRKLQQHLESLKILDTQNAVLKVPQDLRFVQIPKHVISEGELADRFVCELVTPAILGLQDEEKSDRNSNDDSGSDDFYNRKREGLEYIAVSYCWDSYGGYQTTHSPVDDSISIEDKGRRRPLRCPPHVLRRAMNYAITRKIDLIWIDQECIDQEDARDVERHLQSMHLVYYRANLTLGVLATEISTLSQLSILQQVQNAAASTLKAIESGAMQGTDAQPPDFLDAKSASLLQRIIDTILLDPWFTRTWVFQERWQAVEDMRMLFPVRKQALELGADMSRSNHGKDFLLDPWTVWRVSILWLAAAKHKPALASALAKLCVSAMYLARNIEGSDDTESLLTGVNSDFDDDFWNSQGPYDGYVPKMVFTAIERCDNRIVSDRVAILGNVMRIRSYIDVVDQRSYSLAALSLLSINRALPRIVLELPSVQDTSKQVENSLGMLDVHYQLQELRGMRNKFSASLKDDIEALDRILEVLKSSPDSSEPATTYGPLEHRPDPENTATLSKRRIYTIPEIIPTHITIGDILEGVSDCRHRNVSKLTHKHGQKIVQYAIARGQIPAGSTFVAFWDDLRWKPEFIDKYFVTEKSQRPQSLPKLTSLWPGSDSRPHSSNRAGDSKSTDYITADGVENATSRIRGSLKSNTSWTSQVRDLWRERRKIGK